MLQVICLTPDLWQSSRLLPQTAQVTLPLAYVMAGRGHDSEYKASNTPNH